MFFETILIGGLIGFLRGGKLSNLSRLDIRYIPLVFASYLLQAGIDFWGGSHPLGAYPYIHVLSYILLLYAVFTNRSVPGIKLIFAGIVMNFLVIAVNGGAMPVKADVLPPPVAAALSAGFGGTHGLMDTRTHLKLLGDIFYLPLPYQKQLVSLGDIVIDAGLIILLVKGMGNKLSHGR